jgi:hypothetical protein
MRKPSGCELQGYNTENKPEGAALGMITIRMWTLQEGLMICNEKKTHQDAIQ